MMSNDKNLALQRSGFVVSFRVDLVQSFILYNFYPSSRTDAAMFDMNYMSRKSDSHKESPRLVKYIHILYTYIHICISWRIRREYIEHLGVFQTMQSTKQIPSGILMTYDL